MSGWQRPRVMGRSHIASRERWRRRLRRDTGGCEAPRRNIPRTAGGRVVGTEHGVKNPVTNVTQATMDDAEPRSGLAQQLADGCVTPHAAIEPSVQNKRRYATVTHFSINGDMRTIEPSVHLSVRPPICPSVHPSSVTASSHLSV